MGIKILTYALRCTVVVCGLTSIPVTIAVTTQTEMGLLETLWIIQSLMLFSLSLILSADMVFPHYKEDPKDVLLTITPAMRRLKIAHFIEIVLALIIMLVFCGMSVFLIWQAVMTGSNTDYLWLYLLSGIIFGALCTYGIVSIIKRTIAVDTAYSQLIHEKERLLFLSQMIEKMSDFRKDEIRTQVANKILTNVGDPEPYRRK